MESLFDAERARDALIQRQRMAPNTVREPIGRSLQSRFEDADLSRQRLLLLQQAQAGFKLDSNLEKRQRKRLKKRLKQKGGGLGKDRGGRSAVISRPPAEDPEIAREKIRVAEEKIKSDERIAQRLALEQGADRFQRGLEAQDLIQLRDRERVDLFNIEQNRRQLEGQQAFLGFVAESGRQNVDRERIQADIDRYNADIQRAHIERDRAVAVADRELAQIEARNAAEVEQARILRDRELGERDILRREREAELDQQLRLRGIEDKTERERLQRAQRQDQQLHEARIEELRNRRALDAERAAIDRDREATLESTIRALNRRQLPDPIPETQGFTQAQQRFMEQVFQRAGAEVDRRIGESETRIREQLNTFGSQTGQPIDIEFLPREAVSDRDRERAGGGSVNLSVGSNPREEDEQLGGGDLGNTGREGGLNDTGGTERFHTPQDRPANVPPQQPTASEIAETVRRELRQPEPEPPAEELEPLLQEATPVEQELLRQQGILLEETEEEQRQAQLAAAERLTDEGSLDPFGSERERELRRDPRFRPTPESTLSPSTEGTQFSGPEIPAERLRRGGGRGTAQFSGSEEGSGELFLEPGTPTTRTSDRPFGSPLPALVDAPAELERLLALDPATLTPRTLARRGQAVAQQAQEELEEEEQDTPRGLRAIPEGIVAAGQAIVEGVQEVLRPENPAEALRRVEREAERRARAPEVRPGEQFGGQLRAADGSLIVGAQFGIGEDPEIEGFQAVGADSHGQGGGAEQPIGAPQGLELPEVPQQPAGVEGIGGGQVEAVEEEAVVRAAPRPSNDSRVRESNRIFNSSDFNLNISELTTRGRGQRDRGRYLFVNNTDKAFKKLPPGASALVSGAKADGTYKLTIGGQEILMKDSVAERLVKEGKIIVKRR